MVFWDWLLSLSIMLLRFLHVIKSIHRYSFSLLSSIPSYGPTTFVHPPTSWWTLAAMNIYGWAFRGGAFSLLLDRFLQAELLSHGICICLTFKKPEHCFTKSLCHSASPLAVDPSSSFHILTSLATVSLFDHCPPRDQVVVWGSFCGSSTEVTERASHLQPKKLTSVIYVTASQP